MLLTWQLYMTIVRHSTYPHIASYNYKTEYVNLHSHQTNTHTLMREVYLPVWVWKQRSWSQLNNSGVQQQELLDLWLYIIVVPSSLQQYPHEASYNHDNATQWVDLNPHPQKYHSVSKKGVNVLLLSLKSWYLAELVCGTVAWDARRFINNACVSL